MSVLDYSPGDMFIIRTIKYHVNNPADKFSNSYEFVAHGAGSDSVLVSLLSSIVLFEQTMSHSAIAFDHGLISTWQEDSKPYNPDVFISVPLTGNGLITTFTEAVSLTQCLSVVRQCASGRFGHVFYRGMLTEAMTTAPAGRPVLADRAGVQASLELALVSSELANYFEPEGAVGIHMAMIPKSGEGSRPISTFTVSGVTQLPLDHAWFNRTTTPAP